MSISNRSESASTPTADSPALSEGRFPLARLRAWQQEAGYEPASRRVAAKLPSALAGLGQLLREGSSFQAFIGQAMIGPLVTASACEKRAIQHTFVTLLIIHKSSAGV